MKTIRIDASSLVKSSCMRQFYWTTVDGYRLRGRTDPKMHLGSAFHVFAEHYYLTGDKAQAAELGRAYFAKETLKLNSKERFIDMPYFMAMCQQGVLYLSNSPFQPIVHGGVPLVEIKFNIPVYTSDTLVIELCGTIDKIGKFDRGPYCIADYKVTTATDPDKYFDQYRLSTQLLTYLWAFRWYVRNHKGIFETIWQGGKVGAFIDAVFHHGKVGHCDFVRGPVEYKSEELLDEYERELFKCVKKFAVKIEAGELPDKEGLINGTCSSYTSHCQFAGVCGADTPQLAEINLRQNFEQKPYDPLSFR